MWAKRDGQGQLKKSPYGPWVQTGFRVLARLRGLRGTAFDVFGYSEERRHERALAPQYRADLAAMLPKLNAANRDAAVAFAKLPEQIRGFGHVKARHLAAAKQQWAVLLEQFHRGG